VHQAFHIDLDLILIAIEGGSRWSHREDDAPLCGEGKTCAIEIQPGVGLPYRTPGFIIAGRELAG
jgi:hypothetical protein